MELHQAFADWLAAGPEGEPTRDLAIHASGCDDCMRAVATLESLHAVDVGAADPPPARVAGPAPPAPAVRAVRYAVGVVAILVLSASAAVSGLGLLDQAPPTAVEATDSAEEGVLAGAPRDTAEAATPSVSPTTVPAPSSTPTNRPNDAAPTSAPIQTVGPPPPTVQRTPPPQPTGQPLPTAPPTPAPTASPPRTASPSPTPPPPTPTGSPIPTPTDVPTPSPTLAPDDCEDGLDNDDDTFIDIADPDCVATGDESGTLP